MDPSACVFDRSAMTLTLWVDGEVSSPIAVGSTWTSPGMTVAGHGTGASGQQLWWQGGVDDVRTYSGALSDAQVRTIYLEQRTS